MTEEELAQLHAEFEQALRIDPEYSTAMAKAYWIEAGRRPAPRINPERMENRGVRHLQDVLEAGVSYRASDLVRLLQGEYKMGLSTAERTIRQATSQGVLESIARGHYRLKT